MILQRLFSTTIFIFNCLDVLTLGETYGKSMMTNNKFWQSYQTQPKWNINSFSLQFWPQCCIILQQEPATHLLPSLKTSISHKYDNIGRGYDIWILSWSISCLVGVLSLWPVWNIFSSSLERRQIESENCLCYNLLDRWNIATVVLIWNFSCVRDLTLVPPMTTCAPHQETLSHPFQAIGQ